MGLGKNQVSIKIGKKLECENQIGKNHVGKNPNANFATKIQRF